MLYVLQVLQHVRLPLLSPKFLVGTVGSDPLIKSDEECRWVSVCLHKSCKTFKYFWWKTAAFADRDLNIELKGMVEFEKIPERRKEETSPSILPPFYMLIQWQCLTLIYDEHRIDHVLAFLLFQRPG